MNLKDIFCLNLKIYAMNKTSVLLFVGALSWRRTDAGSWFIQAIVWIFKFESHVKDLVEMLGKVRFNF